MRSAGGEGAGERVRVGEGDGDGVDVGGVVISVDWTVAVAGRGVNDGVGVLSEGVLPGGSGVGVAASDGSVAVESISGVCEGVRLVAAVGECEGVGDELSSGVGVSLGMAGVSDAIG
jgi:hypothetical protein